MIVERDAKWHGPPGEKCTILASRETNRFSRLPIPLRGPPRDRGSTRVERIVTSGTVLSSSYRASIGRSPYKLPSSPLLAVTASSRSPPPAPPPIPRRSCARPISANSHCKSRCAAHNGAREQGRDVTYDPVECLPAAEMHRRCRSTSVVIYRSPRYNSPQFFFFFFALFSLSLALLFRSILCRVSES